tara:strand:+ start:160 stop:369 length:210 start_codon:yes stop_codon:yes gene_type:complete
MIEYYYTINNLTKKKGHNMNEHLQQYKRELYEGLREEGHTHKEAIRLVLQMTSNERALNDYVKEEAENA